MASTDKSTHVSKIKGARSLNELLSIVDIIEGNVTDLGNKTDRLISSLSNKKNSITINIKTAQETPSSVSAITEHELGDMPSEPKPKAKGKNTFTKILNKFKAPNTKDLIKNSDAIKELNNNINELEISLRVLQSKDFAKLDENSEASVHIKTVLSKAVKLRDEQLKAMGRIGKDYTPKEHMVVVKKAKDLLVGMIEESSYSSIRTKTFVLNPTPGILYFQTFVVFQDLANKDGYVYENYSCVVTGRFQMSTGELSHSLTTLKDPKNPGSFPVGKEIRNPSELKMRLSILINHDSFVFFKDAKVKHGKTTNQLRYQLMGKEDASGKAISQLSKHIKNIRVLNSDLYVAVSASLTKTQRATLAKKIFPVIRTIFIKRARTNKALAFKDVVSTKTGQPFIVFTLGIKDRTNTRQFINKMEQLVDTLELSSKIKRSVIQKIAEEYEP